MTHTRQQIPGNPSPRDSSWDAICELRAVRAARLAVRAEQEFRVRVFETLAARGQLPAAPGAQAPGAARTSTAPSAAAAGEPARRSRTTFERIDELRVQLRSFAREREERLRGYERNIERLNRRIMHQRARWIPVATAALSAAAVLGLLLAREPTPSSLRTTVGAPASLWQGAREPAFAVTEAGSTAVTPDGPAQASTRASADAGAAPQEVAPAARKPQRRVTPRDRAARRARRPAPRRQTPAELLAGIEDCGDDPLCGL